MILVVDSNIIFAGLLKDNITRLLLLHTPLTLYAPETMLKEIQKYENEIIKRSGLSRDEFRILFSLLTDKIEIIEKEKYEFKLKEADELIGQIDKGDIPFLALALSTPCDGI